MIEIKIVNQYTRIKEQLQSVTLEKGIIMITGSDQNWNTYMLFMVLGLLREIKGGVLEGMPALVDAETDSYITPWMKKVDPAVVVSGQIVYGGDLRDEEKLKNALTVADRCLVIAIAHVNSAEGARIRFKEMGAIPKEEIEEKVKMVITQVFKETA